MDDELLKTEQRLIFTRFIPAITPAAIITLTGIVGNILTIIFFSRQTKRTVPLVLITYLAVADLGVNIVSISVISEMILNIRYDPNALVLCKVSHFMGNWTIGTSWAFLTTINIDRYRKICYPLGRQIPVSALKYIGICVVIFFMLSSTRLLATFDILEVNVTVTSSMNETVTGFHCVANCAGRFESLCLICYFMEYCFNVVGIVAAVLFYSRIIYTLLKRKHEMSRRFSAELPRSENSMKSNCKTSVGFDFCSVNKKPVEWNITFMMFATTVVFLSCFTPYFLIRTLLRADAENEYNAFIQFCLKLPYFNSAANPIIYSIFNVKFRRFIKTSVLKCCKCCRE